MQAAFVSGGAIRLGRHIALHLAASGWDIALHYHSSKVEAQKTQNEISKIGRKCELFCFDFAKEENYTALLHKVCQVFPHLNVLVNNASLYEAAPLLGTSMEMWKRQITVNLQAPFFLMQAFAQELKKARALDSETRASIINILDNKIAFPQYPYCAYVLSKKALAELSSMAALEFAPEIRVNAIAPGVLLPKASRKEHYLQWRLAAIPLQKKGDIRNISLALDYLLKNEFVTGQVLYVDGGEQLGFEGRNFASFRPR